MSEQSFCLLAQQSYWQESWNSDCFENLNQDVMATNFNPEHREGPVATMIEEQTAKLPSDLFYGQLLVPLQYLQ